MLQESSANWTFILWGVLHGLFCCLDRFLDKAEKKVFLPIRWFVTLGIVSVLWLLFSAESVAQWKRILVRIILMQNTEISEGLIASFDLVESRFIYDIFKLGYLSSNIRGFSMLLFILASCAICFIPENNYKRKDKLCFWSLIFSSIAFVWGVMCLGTESVFVYYGF